MDANEAEALGKLGSGLCTGSSHEKKRKTIYFKRGAADNTFAVKMDAKLSKYSITRQMNIQKLLRC